MKKTSIILMIMLLALFVGCGAKTKQSATAETSAVPEGHPSLDATAPPASSAASLAGKVAETMTSGGYTYMRLETDSGETWVAVPAAAVEVGQDVTISVQMEMKDFESSSLGRTFESITFATMGGPAPTSSPGAAPGSPHAGVPGMGSMGSAALDDEPIDVARVEGPDGKTVAEIWAERQALDQKIISVRGKVVKFLPQIMGTNWVHLRDGTGDAADGSHDITITTGDVVAAGDIVTAKGQVRIDHDLGGGYNYPVMIENATMTK